MTQNDAMDIETGGVVDEVTQISRTPNIYILLVDSYLSMQGLKAKNLEALDIGPRLKEKGFVVYDNAFSNYKSSGPSMTAFLDIEHHYYKKKTDRIKKLTGSNQLYELLRENGYKTMVLHPTDFFVRGDCQSDYCYPSPSFFGQIDFILSQTILFSDGFYQRMGVGMFRFKQKFFKTIHESDEPFVIYSHVLLPSHSVRGCSHEQKEVERYASRLRRANDWIEEVVDTITSGDPAGLIVIAGDHGPMIADNCNWSDLDVSSKDAILDNLGILMTVKWPQEYDYRYDQKIHSLMDLSWYLRQFLSNEGFDESQKPSSSSYIRSRKQVFRVVQDGVIISEPELHVPIKPKK